jgi:hypothetical protein
MAELPSLYDTWFHKLTGQGAFPAQAAITVIHRYLGGKSGAKKVTGRNRRSLLVRRFLAELPGRGVS